MTDINAAAERLRALKTALDRVNIDQQTGGGIASPYMDGTHDYGDDLCVILDVLDNHLAEHDPTPITEEWWIEVMPHNPNSHFVEFDDDFGLFIRNDCVLLCAESVRRDADTYEAPLPNIKTRGDVRSLCRVLGIQLEQTKGGE